jgi:hypothetical protein
MGVLNMGDGTLRQAAPVKEAPKGGAAGKR